MADIFFQIPSFTGPLNFKVEKIYFKPSGVVVTTGPYSGEGPTLAEAIAHLSREASVEAKKMYEPKGEPCVKCGSTDTLTKDQYVKCRKCYSFYEI